ncbi:MAG: hypothetical protein P8X91_10915 [Candidatus Bathyarchaeota archaeon]
MLRDPSIWKGKIALASKRSCKKKKIKYLTSRKRDPWASPTLDDLVLKVKNAIISLEKQN